MMTTVKGRCATIYKKLVEKFNLFLKNVSILPIRESDINKNNYPGANMVHKNTDSIQFNVSIGKYGDLMTSSTPTMRVVSDGHKSYYVPWKDEKPCCMVECYWEDVQHRYGAFYTLLP